MNIRELNEALGKFLDESILLSKEEKDLNDAEIDTYLKELFNSSEAQKIMSGKIETFNPSAAALLKPFEDGMKEDIKYAIDNKKDVKEYFDYILTETLTDTITLTTKFYGASVPDDKQIQKFLTSEDYKALVNLNSAVEEKFPYEKYQTEFDLVYVYTFNKIMNYAEENFDKWYSEVKETL